MIRFIICVLIKNVLYELFYQNNIIIYYNIIIFVVWNDRIIDIIVLHILFWKSIYFISYRRLDDCDFCLAVFFWQVIWTSKYLSTYHIILFNSCITCISYCNRKQTVSLKKKKKKTKKILDSAWSCFLNKISHHLCLHLSNYVVVLYDNIRVRQ